MNKTNLNQSVSGNVIMPGVIRNGQEANTYTSVTISSQSTNMTRQAHIGYSTGIMNVNIFLKF